MSRGLGDVYKRQVLSFQILVKDRNHLARIIRDVRNMPNVVRVSRDSA